MEIFFFFFRYSTLFCFRSFVSFCFYADDIFSSTQLISTALNNGGYKSWDEEKSSPDETEIMFFCVGSLLSKLGNVKLPNRIKQHFSNFHLSSLGESSSGSSRSALPSSQQLHQLIMTFISDHFEQE